MQDNIAQMEHHARDPRRAQPQGTPAQQYRSQAQYPERTSSALQAPPQQAQTQDYGAYAQSATYDSMDHPNFSPFPVLRNPPPNVPPTDEQREANLERARMAVLSTTDPEMQLAWAQDALAFVEVAAQNEARLSLTQPPRPHTPQVERQLKNDALNIVGFLAEQHHPKAEFLKGMWLEFGKFNYRVDRKEAFRCYTRAADKGYARAEYRIGMQFESSGEPEKAIKHYERGVSRSDSASYYVRTASLASAYPMCVYSSNSLALGYDDSSWSARSATGFPKRIGIYSTGLPVMRPERTSGCLREFNLIHQPWLEYSYLCLGLRHAYCTRAPSSQCSRTLPPHGFQYCPSEHREGRLPWLCESPGENGCRI